MENFTLIASNPGELTIYGYLNYLGKEKLYTQNYICGGFPSFILIEDISHS